MTLDLARSLASTAVATGRQLSVFQNRRWDSDFLGIRHALQTGTIGDVVEFRSEISRWRPAPAPVRAAATAENQQADRWFLLDTSLDPPRPWSLATPLPVFALALAQGTAPARQWLLYAHAPLGDRKAVGVTIPGYKQVSISGRDLREKLRAGQLPDARVMRPETARILIERMKANA